MLDTNRLKFALIKIINKSMITKLIKCHVCNQMINYVYVLMNPIINRVNRISMNSFIGV